MEHKASEIKVSYKTNGKKMPSIHNSNDAYKFIIQHWDMNNIELLEETKIILLNQANKVLGFYNLSKGGTTSTVVDIKLILSIALKCNAVAIMLVHNHPSGNLVFSKPDIDITKKLKTACDYLDIRLLDHIIISKNAYISFADEKFL